MVCCVISAAAMRKPRNQPVRLMCYTALGPDCGHVIDCTYAPWRKLKWLGSTGNVDRMRHTTVLTGFAATDEIDSASSFQTLAKARVFL